MDVYPLLWSSDVGAIADWAQRCLGLTESWRAADDDGTVEHSELLWPGGMVSINTKRDTFAESGPSGIALRVDDRRRVDELYTQATAAGATIVQGPEESLVAYSFTAVDADGNQWWVNAETGFLDGLRT